MEITSVWPFIGLLIGCALRTLLPYVAAGLEAIRETEDWKAWPKFEPSYLSAFALALIAYVVTMLAVPGAFEQALAMGFVQAVALAYAGQDLARQIIKSIGG